MNKEKIKKILTSKTLKIIVYIVGILAIVSLVFQAGVFTGFKKASFSRDWGNNYIENFGNPQISPRMMNGELNDFSNLPNSHGAIGKIIKINSQSFVVLDGNDNTEKVVLVNNKTEIHKVRESLKINDLNIDENVIVIGNPNSSGQIEARLVRVLPVPIGTPINNN